MRLYALLALAPLYLLHAADPAPPVIVSAANSAIGITADSLASVFGDHIASVTATAPSLPWPTSLGDLTAVWVVDSSGHQSPARLLFVSTTQMNLWIPADLAAGPATLQFPVTGLPPGVGAAALRNVPFTIAKAAPGLFSVDSSGVAAATAIRVTIPTGIQSPVTVFHCDPASMCAPSAIDVGVDAPVYLSLYGTGIRDAAAADIVVQIGGMQVKPAYSGPQGTIPGLDQVNVPLPLSLRGSGIVSVTVTAGGVTSNPVKISIQ
jgi:uncharacterized protein (TIGR03437 family)